MPGSAEYALTVATTGDPATGPLTFLVTDPATGKVSAGDADGLDEIPAGDVTVNPAGRVTAAAGYTVLTGGQAGARSSEITDLTVPTPGGGDPLPGAVQGVRGDGDPGVRRRL